MVDKKLFTKIVFVLFVAFTIAACQSGPEPIAYGEDNCDNCMMTISDPKYGAELITANGKVFKFDSIECLADYSEKMEATTIGSMWVTDFSNKENFLNTKDASFLKSEKLRSPMGLNLSAHKTQDEFNSIKSEFGGDKLSWNELLKYVKTEWH
jgi:copper chaperone NosL